MILIPSHCHCRSTPVSVVEICEPFSTKDYGCRICSCSSRTPSSHSSPVTVESVLLLLSIKLPYLYANEMMMFEGATRALVPSHFSLTITFNNSYYMDVFSLPLIRSISSSLSLSLCPLSISFIPFLSLWVWVVVSVTHIFFSEQWHTICITMSWDEN